MVSQANLGLIMIKGNSAFKNSKDEVELNVTFLGTPFFGNKILKRKEQNTVIITTMFNFLRNSTSIKKIVLSTIVPNSQAVAHDS